jgi:CheY-like chemotaxis protein
MKVLVVDDNRDAALSLSMLVSLLGYESRTAYDGEQALEIADHFVPDVVLLDLGMPKMDGFEACRRIRTRDWGARAAVIAITGWGQSEDQRKTRDAGFDRHLLKPVAADAIVELLGLLARAGGRSDGDRAP